MDRSKRIVKVSIYGIVVNIILVIFKMIVGLISGSIAVILDAVNNLSDALSSIITIVGTALSNKRPDKKHPYGYGRIEYFSSIIIAIIILFAGITSFKESFTKVLHPKMAEYSVASLIIIVVAILVKYFFGRFVKSEGEKLISGSLVASGTDAMSDSFLSFSTLIAAIITLVFNVSLEGYFGLLISIFILKASLEILKDTVDEIIGVRADNEITVGIKKKILTFKGVQGVYDLTLHNYGPNRLIGTAHIQVDDMMTALEIHRLTRRITLDIYKEFGIIITIGIYASNDKGKYGEIQSYLNKLIKNYKSIIQVHGFYVDEEEKTISFDLIFNFDETNQSNIIEEIKDKLSKKYSEYKYDVILDVDFSD